MQTLLRHFNKNRVCHHTRYLDNLTVGSCIVYGVTGVRVVRGCACRQDLRLGDSIFNLLVCWEMAHRNKRGVSRVEFNKRIRDLVSRDTNKLKQTFDKFDREHASRMAEIYGMQEKMRHAMRNLAIDKKSAAEFSEKTRRLSQEHKQEPKATIQLTEGSRTQTRVQDGRKNPPRFSVGSYPVGVPLEVEASEKERRHSLPVYQITNFVRTASKQQQHNGREAGHASRAPHAARQFPANFSKAATHAPNPRENHGSGAWGPHEPFTIKLRARPPRLSVSRPLPVGGPRRFSHAHTSSPPRFKARSLDEDQYHFNKTKTRGAQRPRSTSLCQGLQPIIAIETDVGRSSTDSGVREEPKRRRFSVPSQSAPFVSLSSSENTNEGYVPKARPSSPAIPIPGADRKNSGNEEAILDFMNDSH